LEGLGINFREESTSQQVGSHRVSYRKVAFWAFLLILGLGFGALGWILDVRRTQGSLIRQAEDAISRLDVEISQLQFFPTILANDVRVVNFLRQPQDPIAKPTQDLLDLVRTQTGADRVFVMDRLGRAVLSSPLDPSFVGTSHRRRPFFDEAVSSGFGSFFGTDPLTSKPSYYLASQILDLKSGAFLGAVAVQIDLDKRQSSWQPSQLDAVLLDEFSVVIAATIPEHRFSAWQPLRAEGQRTAEAQLRYPTAVDQTWRHDRATSQLGNTHYDVAEGPLTAKPWSLAVIQRTAETRLTHLYSAAFGFLLFVALLLGGAYVRQQRRFSRSLAQKVREKSQELEAAQQALISRETLSALGRMSAAISHEVSQPIASLRFDLRNLQRALEDDQKQNAITLMSTCRATLARAARVLESLSLFGRRHEADKSLIWVSSVLEAAIAQVQEERPKAASIIRVEDLEQDSQILANSILLRQVLVNLLTNALSATQHVTDPAITIGAHLVEAEIKIYVQDNGKGLDAEQTEHIFEPFRSSKPLGEGMGVGLHLSKTIIEDMGGRIAVVHDDGQSGCRFVLSLPRAGV